MSGASAGDGSHHPEPEQVAMGATHLQELAGRPPRLRALLQGFPQEVLEVFRPAGWSL